MRAFKVFNKDMTCKGFKFEEGKTYETDKAELCKCGFHACENPIDCLRYYNANSSIYRIVELEDVSDERESDSKIVGKKITIGRQINFKEICEFANEYLITKTKEKQTAGDYGAATAGDHGAATAGGHGAATVGGHGAATAGDYGAATAGDYGAATVGYYGAATAGDHGAATAGDCGAATSKGSSESGEYGLSVVRGNDIKAKGGIGALLVIANENIFNSFIADYKAVIVDGKKIKADTWYKLVNGELQECE